MVRLLSGLSSLLKLLSHGDLSDLLMKETPIPEITPSRLLINIPLTPHPSPSLPRRQFHPDSDPVLTAARPAPLDP
jgi:hypothetical protein